MYLIFGSKNESVWNLLVCLSGDDVYANRRGPFDERSTEYDEVPRPIAYGRVLNTWSKWVEDNINPNRTKVFFSSMSPLHIK